jgi:hypothetical protein
MLCTLARAKSSLMFQIAAVIFWFISGPTSVFAAQSDSAPLSAHGTINIVLANRTGMVVVTDSNLTDSQGKLYRYEAPKLFRLDDETVCTIAGSYFKFGPELGVHSYPALQLVSNSIAEYLDLSKNGQRKTIEEKADLMARLLDFALNLADNALIAQKKFGEADPLPSPLVLTVAGYENGQSKAVQLILIPKLSNGTISYMRAVQDQIGPCENSFIVQDSFACSLAGKPKVAANILNGEDSESLSDPVVSKFLEARRNGHLGELDLDELIALAKYLKERTAEYYKNIDVGGQTEIAIFSAGKLKFIQPVEALPLPKPERFSILTGLILNGGLPASGALPTVGGLYVPAGLGTLLVGMHVANVVQPLDNAIFTHSFFQDCSLTYAGSAMTLFDDTNVIQNCKLIVLRGVNPASPFLAAFRRDFPNIKVIHGSFVTPTRWMMKRADR